MDSLRPIDLRFGAHERGIGVYLVDFGVNEDVAAHLDRLDAELDRWAGRVHDGVHDS